MGFLNGLAWLVFGGMGIKDVYDNNKYINESKQRMVDDDRLFYCDSKGRMYYRYTGEEVILSFRNGRRVYVGLKSRAVVCDLTAVQYKKQIDEWAKTHRHMSIRPDGGRIDQEFDFKYRRFYELKLDLDKTSDNYGCLVKRYLKPDGEYDFDPDGPWFKIDEKEYLELGGRKSCVEESKAIKQELNAMMTDTEAK